MFAVPKQPAPVQPVALEQEREAFEAWHDSFFVNKGHAAHHRFHDRDGYCIDEIQNQWKGWKERAKRTTPPPQEIMCSTGLCHYKAPRQWAGLTDEEFIDLCEEASNFGTGGLIRHIEAKLKEKNQ